jgi:iron(III) transport system ATP-binding protein
VIKLEVHQLTKNYNGNGYPAVNNVSFGLRHGEILALVGPSGCGKTTTLRLIAGLEVPDTGVISLNNRVVTGESQFVPPENREVGMVFQEHALFPHLTVFENVAFGLHKQDKALVQKVVLEYLKMVGLQALAKRYPHELSGGERQRVALVRALAPQPVVLLLDEPFSSLDADLRTQVRVQTRSILKSIQATAIFVTHDQEEALFMGDRLAVFQNGMIEQIGKPEEVFHASRTQFVAEFMGDSDFIQGETTLDGVCSVLGIVPQRSDLPIDTKVEIAVRADDVDFRPHHLGNGVIDERIFRGAFYVYRLKLDSGQSVHTLKPHTELLPIGTRVHVFISAEHPLSIFRNGSSIVTTQAHVRI